MKTAKEDNEETGSGFYRVEDTERKTKNDDSLYGYASATIFSSLMNLDVSHLFQSLFMEGGKNFYCYNGATPLSSSLFSVKYMLSDSALEESPYRTLIGGSGSSFLYRNNYSLPLGFVMDEQAIANWTLIDCGPYGITQFPDICTWCGGADALPGDVRRRCECGRYNN